MVMLTLALHGSLHPAQLCIPNASAHQVAANNLLYYHKLYCYCCCYFKNNSPGGTLDMWTATPHGL